MSKEESRLNKKDCSMCIMGETFLCPSVGNIFHSIQLVMCTEPKSDHYGHFIALGHPACEEVTDKYPEGGK